MDAAEKIAREIAETYSTQPVRMGREWRCFCPVHEADGGMHKPSLAIWPTSEGRYAFKCMTGCTSRSVAEALRDRGLKFGIGGKASPSQAIIEAKRREDHRVQQLRKIEEIMSEITSIDPGSPQHTYLLSRGLTLTEEFQFNGTLFSGEDPLFRGNPALIATILDPTTLDNTGYASSPPRLVGLSILSLHDDGAARIGDKTGKKLRSVIGTQRGFGVPFGKPGSHVVIAEGVESMLAARQLLRCEFGIATLAAPNMPMLKLPEYVTHVTVAADNDTAGLEASAQLMTDLGHMGIKVCRAVYGEGNGFDAADELLRRKS